MILGNKNKFGIEIIEFDNSRKYGNYQLWVCGETLGDIKEFSIIYTLRNELLRIMSSNESKIDLFKFTTNMELFKYLLENNFEVSFIGETFDDFTNFVIKKSEFILFCWKSYKTENENIYCKKIEIEDLRLCFVLLNEFLVNKSE